MRYAGAVLGLMLAAGAAFAQAPDRSPRPLARPGVAAVDETGSPAAAIPALGHPVISAPAAPVMQAATAPEAGPGQTIRPRLRPAGLVAVPAVTTAPKVVQASAGLPSRSLRPAPRPKGLVGKVQLASANAVRITPGKQAVVSKKGSVCGDPAIRGEVLSPIGARVDGCGIPEPVRITSVAGIRLSQAATVDCPTARALKSWIEKGLEPAYGEGKVVQLQVAGHYVCRTRNHRKGAKISEHGRGRAIDISGFTFSNGKSVSVLRNYDKTMRQAYKAACGIFGTTLGPGSDGMHEDHLHLDTARHRNGAYCR